MIKVYSRRQLMASKPYDAEIEYLESTGTQYIDTGIPLYSDMEIGCNFTIITFVHHSMILGANNKTTIPRNGLYSMGLFAYNSSKIMSSNYNSDTDGLVMDVGYTYSILKKNNVTYVDGELKMNETAVAKYSAGGNCFLFWGGGMHADISTNKSIVRIASFYIKDSNSNMLLDFIPVRKNNIGYMYDKVSGKLFGNSGTGNFILGPDK